MWFCNTRSGENLYVYTDSDGNIQSATNSFTFYVDYFWKPASGGCNNTGWTCIQDLFGAATSASGPTLTAGVQYYIMADPETTTAGSVTFNMVCPRSNSDIIYPNILAVVVCNR
ncbi:MAG: hypothetical protein IPI22_11215 [Bacteroidetes bacterium]|nr:hypothetical protein [Bacteroidota bacterium]